MSFATKTLENNQQNYQIEVTEQDGTRSVRNLGQKCAEAACCDGSLEVSAFLKAKIQQTQKNKCDHHKGSGVYTGQPPGSPGKVVGDFRQPLVIDPRSPGHGKGVKIMARELMILEKIFGVAQVPPDVRIGDGSTRQNELQCDQEKGEHGQEGTRPLKPAAKSGLVPRLS